MVSAKDFNELLKKFEVPATKVPVLKWTKKPTKAELAEGYSLEDGRLAMFFNMKDAKKGYYINEVLSKEDYDSENYIILEKNSKDTERFYMTYIPEYDSVVIGRATIDCRAVKKDNENTPRSWKRGGEIILTKDKRIFYPSSRWVYDHGRYSYVSDVKASEHAKLGTDAPFNISNIVSYKEVPVGVNDESYKQLAQELLKMFPRFCNVGANKMYDLTEHAYHFEAFLAYKEPTLKTGPKQKKINELVALPLSEIKYEGTYSGKMAFIEKVSDGLCVLRTMMKDDVHKVMVDAARIYVSKNEIVACRPDNVGNWVNMVLKSNAYNWDFALQEFNAEDVKGTQLEYFGSVVNDVPEETKGKLIQAMLSYPVIEQLAKAGMKPFVLQQIKHVSWTKAIEPFEQVFGKFDLTKKSLFEQMGVNKYQFKVVCDLANKYNIDEDYRRWGYNPFAPLLYLKRIFNDNYVYRGYRSTPDDFISIAHIDNNTFDILIKALIDAKEALTRTSGSYYYDMGEFVNAVARTRQVYNQQVMMNMLPALVGAVGKRVDTTSLHSRYAYSQSILKVYSDYLDMVAEMDDTTHFRPNFSPENPQEVKEMHDAIIAVYNLKRDEIQAKEFGKIADSWNKWLYEDENFAIVAPKAPNDIAYEGITLHHCVKSYISRVLARTTNILFLRRKEDVSKPFFTIEVSNDGSIQQIHGFGNCNLDSAPEAEPFVKAWVKNRKLKTTNFNKVR